MHRRPRPSGPSGVRGRHARLRGALLRGGQAIGPRRPAHRHRPGRGGAHRGRREVWKTIPAGDRPELALLRGNFGDLDELLASCEIPGIDAILFDLGVSSVQIDTQSRGFSFKENGPLDMRMDPGKTNPNRRRDRQHLQRSRSHSDHSQLLGREVGEPHRGLHREGAGGRSDNREWSAGRCDQGGHTRLGEARGGDIPPSAPSKPFGLKSTRS